MKATRSKGIESNGKASSGDTWLMQLFRQAPASGSPQPIAQAADQRAQVDGSESLVQAMESALGQLQTPVAVDRAKLSSLAEILERVGPVSPTLTQRRRERPYTQPPEWGFAGPGRPLELSELDESKRYLWVVDEGGRFLFAPEEQEAFIPDPKKPDGRRVTHGDLCPGSTGRSRGPARSGGEMYAERKDGRVVWRVDMSSSYSFNRSDGRILGDRELAATIEYLHALGTDTQAVQMGRNTFDPLRKVAGLGFLLKHRLGLGGQS